MYRPEGRFPVKIDYVITTYDKLEEEARQYDEKYFNNEPLPEDTSDILYIPYDRADEFYNKFQELVEEFQKLT